MNNVCVYGEEIELSTKGGQPTLMGIYTEMNRLKRENEILKANNYELKKENLQLRSDNILLHNRLDENSQEQYEESMLNEDLSYMDKYAEGNEELIAKMYEVTSDDYKFGGHDLKKL